jgi:hypothetical protein
LEALQLDLCCQRARGREPLFLGFLREQLQTNDVVQDAFAVFGAQLGVVLALGRPRIEKQHGLGNRLAIDDGHASGSQRGSVAAGPIA